MLPTGSVPPHLLRIFPGCIWVLYGLEIWKELGILQVLGGAATQTVKSPGVSTNGKAHTGTRLDQLITGSDTGIYGTGI